MVDMKTRDLILSKLKQKGELTTSDIVKLTGISRQTIAEHFQKLTHENKIVKIGSTHNAKYVLPSGKQKFKNEFVFIREYKIKGLSEDKVFNEISYAMNLKQLLSENCYKIVNYAFTEMLNNAIDHSRSKNVKVKLRCLNGEFGFEVIDHGIGVFESIRKKFKLKNHLEATEHLLKGKQTTDPKHHSGQGIFFTSKISDRFILESAKLRLAVDKGLQDTFLGDIKLFKGTKVIFCIKQKTRKTLQDLFEEYQNSEFEFDKTKLAVKITLSSKESEYVSRSEAKRLLFGLEKFKRIVLDFKGVKGIGQGFADEIFRVFKSNYPAIKIEPINMKKPLEFMVKRALK